VPNLKSIKVRIKSIKSTQKITQAMKLVAASKVRKAQVRVLNSRPYSRKISDFTVKTVQSISPSDRQEFPLMKKREVKTVGIIVISSDRGLCGSYNTNIIKRTAKRIQELESGGITVKLTLVGNKANNFFKRAKVQVIDSFTQLPAAPTVELANLIAQSAENAFISNTVDSVEIIGTDFVSMLRNEVYIKKFLPIGDVSQASKNNDSNSQSGSFMLFEPSLNEVLGSLLPLYLSNIVFHALLEANCSELASRMNAMSNATKNAKELIDLLTIVYNKARQAAITQELTEIVGGVEALK
jgi:F-type H+-transporting ATPase subunit gamma